jgi:hypothetical protein
MDDVEAAIKKYCGNHLVWSDEHNPLDTKGALELQRRGQTACKMSTGKTDYTKQRSKTLTSR